LAPYEDPLSAGVAGSDHVWFAGGAAYMGLESVGGLNLADLRGGESSSDSDSD